MKSFPTLYKRTSSGKTQIWFAEVDGNRYRTTTGQINGKKTTTMWTVAEPTNVGRANEMTAEQQAVSEVESMYTKKRDQGYKDDANDIDNIFQFKPMLATKWDNRKDKIEHNVVEIQPKLDGIRCIVRADGMWTRTGKEITSCPHIFEAVKHLFAQDPKLILDGELYNHAFKNDFNQITSLVKRQKSTQADYDKTAELVQYWVYDVARTADFTQRFAYLENMFKGNQPSCVVITPTRRISIDRVDDVAMGYIEEGYEGAMIRLPGTYKNKRSINLIKWKEMQDAEFTIVDVVEGSGNRSGVAAAVTLRLDESGRTFNAGCIGNVNYCRNLLENREEVIGQPGTVVFQNYTPDGVPRFPKLKTIRDYE